MSTTTDRPPAKDWDAWLGELPPEKRHLTCGNCATARGEGSVSGRHVMSLCGVPFVAIGGAMITPPEGRYCDDCLSLLDAPCSQRRPRGRKS